MALGESQIHLESILEARWLTFTNILLFLTLKLSPATNLIHLADSQGLYHFNVSQTFKFILLVMNGTFGLGRSIGRSIKTTYQAKCMEKVHFCSR